MKTHAYVTVDRAAGAAYIYLTGPIPDGGVANSRGRAWHQPRLWSGGTSFGDRTTFPQIPSSQFGGRQVL